MPMFSGIIKAIRSVPKAVKVGGSAIAKTPSTGKAISSAGSKVAQTIKGLPIVRTVVGSFTGLGIYEVIKSYSNKASNAMSDAATAIADTIGVSPAVIEVMMYCGIGIAVVSLIIFLATRKKEQIIGIRRV